MTKCNGHCSYCPFDDIYLNGILPYSEMSFADYAAILKWLKSNQYENRIGFLLHYEPTLDTRLVEWIKYTRTILPNVCLEIATNGLVDSPVLKMVDVVDCVPINSGCDYTSRAGNVKACCEIASRKQLAPVPCTVPQETMCIAANGDVLLCCQDWRHEAVVGISKNLTTARKNQLKYAEKAGKLELEICRDCASGKTAEEVGDRLGKRNLN